MLTLTTLYTVYGSPELAYPVRLFRYSCPLCPYAPMLLLPFINFMLSQWIDAKLR